MSGHHTAGPWKHVAIDHGWDGVAPASGGTLICKLFENNPANARLIAAAPALLEALEGCLHFDDAFIRDGVLGNALRQWREAAHAAIAAATGEA